MRKICSSVKSCIITDFNLLRNGFVICRRIKRNEKTFAVGIAGGSASGKSSLCDRLEKQLEEYNKKVILWMNILSPRRNDLTAKHL